LVQQFALAGTVEQPRPWQVDVKHARPS